MCALRVLDGVRRGYPEAGYLLDCLVEHALSDDLQPTTEAMTADEAREVFVTQ